MNFFKLQIANQYPQIFMRINSRAKNRHTRTTRTFPYVQFLPYRGITPQRDELDSRGLVNSTGYFKDKPALIGKTLRCIFNLGTANEWTKRPADISQVG